MFGEGTVDGGSDELLVVVEGIPVCGSGSVSCVVPWGRAGD